MLYDHYGLSHLLLHYNGYMTYLEATNSPMAPIPCHKLGTSHEYAQQLLCNVPRLQFGR